MSNQEYLIQVTRQKCLSVISQHFQPEKHPLGTIMRMKEIVSDKTNLITPRF